MSETEIEHSSPTEDEVDDAVSAWHAGPSEKPLHEYLGWSETEYAAWVANPEAIPQRPLA